VRAAWAKGNEEAKDLTQAFFLWLAEGDALRRFEPGRGGLRQYLRVLLRSFMGHHEEALGRLKRGGAATVLSFDAGTAELEEFVPDPKASDPESAYDRSWRTTVVRHAIQCLRERCRAGGRATAYRIFEDYELTPGAVRPTYRELALRHGIEESRVKGHLLEMRDELRAEIRRELSRLGTQAGDVDAEWSDLFGS
jgi:RNA polymerase sigma-70 factor (ECF subfamily)